MPLILYNDVLLSPVSEFSAVYRTTMDDSGTDHVYTTLDVTGQFEVCGQVEVLSLDDPPVSYQAGDGTKFVKEGGPPIGRTPLAEGVAKDTEGPERQKGAVDDRAGLAAKPYAGTVNSPAYAVENRQVRNITFGPARPLQTWNLIWPRLSMPRGRLIVFEPTTVSTGETMVISPAYGYHCDAKSGPIPTLVNNSRTQGDDTTFYVTWSCRTYLSAKLKTGDSSLTTDPLLSNRWTMTHHVIDGGWTDIHVQGTAVFDVGVLHKRAVNPDVYRPDLMLPVPAGFERKDIVVSCSEDMSTLHYSFVDHQVPVMFPAGVYENVTDIETQHRQYVLCDGDVLTGAMQSIDSILNRRWLLNAGGSSPDPKTKKGKPPGTGRLMAPPVKP